jgi:hypothetical protein
VDTLVLCFLMTSNFSFQYRDLLTQSHLSVKIIMGEKFCVLIRSVCCTKFQGRCSKQY